MPGLYGKKDGEEVQELNGFKTMKPNYYIASCSFCKDSIATILTALEHQEPLDEVIFCEVMFDEVTSGESPEHIDFIYNVAMPKLYELGVPKITIVRAKKTYIDYFYKERKKGNYIGKLNGFPLSDRCHVKRNLKIRPLVNYINQLKKKYNVIEYIGICADERHRFNNIRGNKRSILLKYHLTQIETRNIAIRYGLYSPTYKYTHRQGCWFCPNARINYFAHIKQHYNKLWIELQQLSNVENTVSNSFSWGESFETIEDKVNKYIKYNKEFPEIKFTYDT